MKILFVNQYYWPDIAATAQQLTDLAESLAADGDEVEVLCSRGLYDDQDAREDQDAPRRNGVRIRRMRPWGSRTRGMVGRMIGYIGFHVGCAMRVLFGGWRYDVIVTLTDPPLVGLHAALLRRLSFGRVRHVVWSMDLYPDCLFALEYMRPSSIAARALEMLSRFELGGADAVVALGACMRRRLEDKGVAPERIRTIGVWSDIPEPAPAGGTLRSELGLDGKFVVMYSGNAGRAHTFEAICAAMATLADDRDVHFLFVGGGKRLEEITDFSREHGLENFTSRGYFPRERLGESLGLGDVHLVSLRDAMSGVVVPCKLYGIMGVGRPVLFVGPRDSTIAASVIEAEAGAVVASDDPEGVVAAIRRLAADRDEARRLGDNGRRFFQDHHERSVCVAEWAALLHQVAAADATGVAPVEQAEGG